MSPGDDVSVRALLEELGLEGLASRFEAEEITTAMLPYLDDATLRGLGVVTVGTRLKIRAAVGAIKQQQQLQMLPMGGRSST